MGKKRTIFSRYRQRKAALTGTPFHRLRDKAKRLTHVACIADRLSIRKTAARLDTRKKAFRWRHKFLGFPTQQKPEAMSGIVEADEALSRFFTKGNVRGCPVSPRNGAAPSEITEPKRPRCW